MAAPMRSDESRYQRYAKLITQLKNERTTWEPRWRDVVDYIMPLRGRLGGDAVSEHNRGDRSQSKILDPTATQDADTLSSGMMVGITSPARPWFQLATPDDDLNDWSPAKRWLEEVARREANLFRASNLYNVLPEVYLDLGGLGTTALGFMEDDEDVYRFQPFPIGTYYLATGNRSSIDTVVICEAKTVRQVVIEYGFDACSLKVQALWNAGNTEQAVEVWQVICPNDEQDGKRIGAQFKAFRSCHFEGTNEGEKFLRESGFDEMPVLTARWSTSGRNVYGDAPGFKVLPDVKALQVLERRLAQGVDKMLNPPLLAPSDLASGEVDTRPGAVNYYSRNAQASQAQQVVPLYNVNLPIDAVAMLIQKKQAAIHRGLFADLFLMLTFDARAQPPTAAEIYERKEEKLLALGPVLERLNDEFLDPLVGRGFNIMARRGLLPPPPRELEGMPLAVRYVSVMAQAQKLAGLSSQERLIGHVGSIAAIHPEVLDTIDWDKHVEVYADRVGAPATIVRSPEEIAAIRSQRQQAQQASQAIAGMQGVAKTARDLSAAKLGDDNALSQLAGRTDTN